MAKEPVDQLTRIERDVKDIKHCLFGKNGEPGLRMRVDRIEQRLIFAVALVTVVMTLGLKWLGLGD